MQEKCHSSLSVLGLLTLTNQSITVNVDDVLRGIGTECFSFMTTHQSMSSVSERSVKGRSFRMILDDGLTLSMWLDY